mmetsp:Transcript_4109/g.10672  ORF Transcript_4109/g.10672 Transcript_4109/m.10672 type:complete len:216 (-) Transcript_4109:1195-1842(-)
MRLLEIQFQRVPVGDHALHLLGGAVGLDQLRQGFLRKVLQVEKALAVGVRAGRHEESVLPEAVPVRKVEDYGPGVAGRRDDRGQGSGFPDAPLAVDVDLGGFLVEKGPGDNLRGLPEHDSLRRGMRRELPLLYHLSRPAVLVGRQRGQDPWHHRSGAARGGLRGIVAVHEDGGFGAPGGGSGGRLAAGCFPGGIGVVPVTRRGGIVSFGRCRCRR